MPLPGKSHYPGQSLLVLALTDILHWGMSGNLSPTPILPEPPQILAKGQKPTLTVLETPSEHKQLSPMGSSL